MPVSSGSHYRTLDVPGQADLIGRSVHYCATCDGPLYRDKSVLVVGGGNSGFEEGLFLSTIASEVTIVEFDAKPKASQILQHKVAARPNMTVLTRRAVREFKAESTKLSAVLIENLETGKIEELNPDGFFVFIGLTPNTDFLPSTIRRDSSSPKQPFKEAWKGSSRPVMYGRGAQSRRRPRPARAPRPH